MAAAPSRPLQIAESELRNAAAKRIEDATTRSIPRKISTCESLNCAYQMERNGGSRPRQTFALSAYPRLPLKFNTSTNTELMKPIPGTLQEGGASFQTTHWTLILSAQKSEQKELSQRTRRPGFCLYSRARDG